MKYLWLLLPLIPVWGGSYIHDNYLVSVTMEAAWWAVPYWLTVIVSSIMLGVAAVIKAMRG